ncbi:MAG: DUF4150 domain-containing protein [Deltaproteobacteria bacterium]|jgi:hypothetical protein|nr:DUF4150 domain-containing protein [Deltaproteobacteria bacterium]
MFALTTKGGQATSTVPDVCQVPTPPAGPIPTPLVNLFMLNTVDPSTACQKIFIDGAMALNVQSKTQTSQGDEAGTAGGIVSGRFMGPGSFSPIAGSFTVSFEGKGALPMGGMTQHNGDANFNTIGMCPMGAQSKVSVSL